jgi:hypothetical protein
MTLVCPRRTLAREDVPGAVKFGSARYAQRFAEKPSRQVQAPVEGEAGRAGGAREEVLLPPRRRKFVAQRLPHLHASPSPVTHIKALRPPARGPSPIKPDAQQGQDLDRILYEVVLAFARVCHDKATALRGYGRLDVLGADSHEQASVLHRHDGHRRIREEFHQVRPMAVQAGPHLRDRAHHRPPYPDAWGADGRHASLA